MLTEGNKNGILMLPRETTATYRKGVRKVSIDKLDLLMGIFAAFSAGVGTGMIIILAIAENTFSSFKEDRIKRKQKAAYRHEQRRK